MTADERRGLEVVGLAKSYGAVQALSDVTFHLNAGEVLGLLGDNGAGKSTLVRCVSGVAAPDGGTIRIWGEPVVFGGPNDAKKAGIETVYQDLALIETMDVAANVYLNREIVKGGRWFSWFGWLDKHAMLEATEAHLNGLGIAIPSVRRSVDTLSGGQRQATAVARAVAWGRRIVIMDEPAAALGVEQTRLVLDMIRQLKATGIAVLVISHNMAHVVDVCDRAVVLRHGRKVGDVSIDQVTPRDLVNLIAGVA